jgi:hypothetical protein
LVPPSFPKVVILEQHPFWPLAAHFEPGLRERSEGAKRHIADGIERLEAAQSILDSALEQKIHSAKESLQHAERTLSYLQKVKEVSLALKYPSRNTFNRERSLRSGLFFI